MHKSFSNKSKQDFDETVEKFQKHLSSSGTDLARVMLDVGKMSETQKIFVESSQAKIAKLEEEFSRNDVMLKEEKARSEREFAEMNENLSERRREIGALQRKLESRAKLIIEEFNQSMDEVLHRRCPIVNSKVSFQIKTDIDLLKTRTTNDQNQVEKHLNMNKIIFHLFSTF